MLRKKIYIQKGDLNESEDSQMDRRMAVQALSVKEEEMKKQWVMNLFEWLAFKIMCILLRREVVFTAVSDALMSGGMHIHNNPRKRKSTAVVDFPEAKDA